MVMLLPGVQWTHTDLLAEKGLKLFEAITYLDEYYLTNAEIDALTKHADVLAEHIPTGARVIELGSGYVIFLFFILCSSRCFSKVHIGCCFRADADSEMQQPSKSQHPIGGP